MWYEMIQKLSLAKSAWMHCSTPSAARWPFSSCFLLPGWCVLLDLFRRRPLCISYLSSYPSILWFLTQLSLPCLEAKQRSEEVSLPVWWAVHLAWKYWVPWIPHDLNAFCRNNCPPLALALLATPPVPWPVYCQLISALILRDAISRLDVTRIVRRVLHHRVDLLYA